MGLGKKDIQGRARRKCSYNKISRAFVNCVCLGGEANASSKSVHAKD